MKKFNSVGNISFTVITKEESKITEAELMYAVLRRLVILPENEIAEAIELSDTSESNNIDRLQYDQTLDIANEDRSELSEKLLEKLKGDIEQGDYTVLFSLLEFLPSKILKDAL